MIIRKTPKNKNDYLMIEDSGLAYTLQLKGFMPKYIDENAMYFIWSRELTNVIKQLRMEEQ